MYDSGWYKIVMYGLEFLGRYYSSYRGFVVDNDDPKGLNRIKIISPIIDSFDNTEGAWAYPKTNWGGKGYGFNILPQKGDMIWVEFEHGDLNYPIWSFASYGTDEKPTEFDSPNKYGFKTPAGSIIIIDDTEGVESILVKHHNELEYIKLVKEKVELEALQIYLGKDGDEKAVLGETLLNKMEQILDKIDSSHSLLIAHTHTTNTGPSGPPINATGLTTVKSDLITIRGLLSQFLSNKVKLDR